MKRNTLLIVCALVCVVALIVSGISFARNQSSNEEAEVSVSARLLGDNFVEVDNGHGELDYGIRVFYEKSSHIMYMYYDGRSGLFSSNNPQLTVMLKADGKPLTYDEWRASQDK